jgi:L-lactate dehydrogenase complex protein LldF
MNTCPVYRRSGGHSYGTVIPGPIGSVLAGAEGSGQHASLPFACSLCASCDAVCPVRIDLHDRLYEERTMSIASAQYAGKRKALAAAAFVMARPRLFRGLRALLRWCLPRLPERIVYSRFNRWGIERQVPMPAKKSFRQQYRERKK